MPSGPYLNLYYKICRRILWPLLTQLCLFLGSTVKCHKVWWSHPLHALVAVMLCMKLYCSPDWDEKIQTLLYDDGLLILK